ncbi:hypothetical protein PAXRUDRAFT_829728 [Paxillus rubicundulus Ve08.2h10]|uniref:Sacsin/Nov domain-containing protein n=1 Tax=Paxillus rubicundulus Ve08.2h10 TaxID=930991 RepID=A0A0D0DM87_9AGAM|nr:hypothetical protein PAXRUDRAFT_829728 [Paxillus rubicundulus Ve08.2h10]
MARDRDALWKTGQDESVEVNQRALIDKVLARYSGEFTVFRELLQNSDDAQSSAVEIRFETAEYLHLKSEKEQGVGPRALPDLKSSFVVQWTFRNNGIPFRDEDWTRLRKIAEGNPDEEKIGAFGVGFYSLFSVTENPFVASGGHGMEFYWKDNKDQLYVRRGDLPSKGTSDPWTRFEMTLREAGSIPPAFDFMRFLASSITFMVHLNEVGVFFDEHRIGHIKKSPGLPKALDLPRALRRSSDQKVMNVKGIQFCPIRIKAEVMHAVFAVGTEKRPVIEVVEPQKPKGGFFSSLVSAFTSQSSPQPETPVLPPQPHKDPTEIHEINMTLTIFTAEVDVKVDKKFSAELLRSTKKNPPSRLRYDLIYTGKDEYDQSVADEKNQPVACGSIFQGLCADLNGVGHTRVFIGHATGQTTGIGGHMASRFIPTVERESIDLVDRNIALWNKELLYVGGFLSRAAYELELSNIHNLWEGATRSDGELNSRPLPVLEDWLRQRFLHVLKFFTFRPSTPSSEVARLLEASFYGCSTAPLRLLSSAGVRGAPDIKEFDPVFAQFLKNLPVLPQSVIQEGALQIRALQNRGMIPPISFLDVLQELRVHPLNEDELVACLKWWTSLKQDNPATNMVQIHLQLLEAASLNGADGRVLPLSSVQHFINTRSLGTHIPLDGPLPASLMPSSVTKHFSVAELKAFNWQELTIIDWLHHISKPDIMLANPEYDFTESVGWAERVLAILSRVWSSLPSEVHTSVKAVFAGKKCIHTSHGLQPPELSYFPNANITMFNDLPMVQFPSSMPIKGQMEKLLSFIGVRKHVDLQLIFDRMVKTGDWSIPDLIGYLVQVRDTLTKEELSRLASTTAFTKEGIQQESNKKARYCAHDLYEPADIFRQLQLPVINWGVESKWRSNSEEAKLLYRLGLRRYPPLETAVQLCASPDATVRMAAFKFLCDNMSSRYPEYNPDSFANIAFVPAENDDGLHLETLGNVFYGNQWKALGFSIVQSNFREATEKLGVKQHPPTPMLLSMLEKTPPASEAIARQWFDTLSEHISRFTQSQLVILSGLPIVPRKGSVNQPLQWLAPSQCYLGDGTKGEFHSKLFVFVDFGPVANRFLSACGSKNEPSVEEVAEILIRDPKKFYELAGGYENFLAELRNLAVNHRLIPPATLNRMRISPVLLGVCRQKATKASSEKSSGWDEDEWEDLHDLRKPRDIVIADDTNTYQLFGDSIFTAPQEDLLEGFYETLGSKRLTVVVREEYKASNERLNAKVASDVRTLVLERLPLFLHEHTHTRTKVSFSWLESPQNFRVKAFGNLSISRTLDVGNGKTVRTQDASAAAKRNGQGPIELWLSYGGQVDMYEVATSLCRLLFETVKVNDTLLFMTILSTDLKALKRRGYNVDKILRQQQQNRMLAEEARKSRYIGSEVSNSSATIVPHAVMPQPVTPTRLDSVVSRSKSPTPRPGLPGGWESASDSPPALPPRAPAPPAEEIESVPQTGPSPVTVNNADGSITDTLRNLKRKLVAHVQPPKEGVVRTGMSGQSSQTIRQVTPQSNIRANVDMAIRSCKPEQGKLLNNRKGMEMVSESLNEGYCDVAGQVGQLEHLGTMGDVKVFATQDVPNTNTFMTRMHDPLARFVHIITPIARTYNLPMTSLHIFYDMAGGLIAFNRNGSLFLNLRYFEAWHDQDVKNGERERAQISWFFTLAHEIAHNLVEPHNSEHEFYFSAICEAHIVAFSQLLTPSES